ncbi:uncharacterized protein EAF02_008276 [Botrytis sinoallii]|uniref:uncharacterized protein n=1 Tax=Botrytis sinoallii TaxID=1463999 RepID=UPI001900A538|nr:uncharacterized protein EAF02_008276 [Botrytis sinoallii]KAF7877056.1 hypothetical protein EAF02_008276 [Botrytis sinoallii]
MGVTALIATILEENKIAVAFLALLAYPISSAIYNIYFHPLAKFPGPKLWTASRLPFIYYLLTGQLVKKVKEFHDIYGEFYRLAPDEVSFASEQAWNDIYTFRRGHKRALRDKIREAAEKPENSTRGARINITDWLNFFTMDIIGDLAFGAPYLKGMSITAAPRFYPTMEFLFQKLIPKRIMEKQRQHSAYAEKMINRRLDTKGDRPDFMTPFMRNNVNFENMSREEIVSTFNFIIVGGSETSAAVMTGIFNHFTKKKNKRILDRLCNDIRTKFREEKEITLDAIQSTPIPYLEAVINEGLRICNSIPSGLPRVVPEGGDEYCDPDEFVPERWLPKDQQPKKYANDQLSASKTFSVGFHSCLGRPLAWAEIRLAVTRLLWTFNFSVDAEDEVDFDEFPVIMIIQRAPMNLRAKIRPGI